MSRASARRAALVALALGFLVAPLVVAHGTDHDEEQLLRNGDRLLVGRFAAPQPGPLLVVPYEPDALDCVPAGPSAFRVRLGPNATATVRANATHVQAGFDLASPGYVAFAVDTHNAARALLLMEEHAVAFHRLAAEVPRPGDGASPSEERVGLLGLPYQLPGASRHSLGHATEDTGPHMSYDAPNATLATFCRGTDGEHQGIALARAALPDSLSPGMLVHAVLLYDPRVPEFLPRPLDSTQVLQLNVYLARPGEDPEEIRRALDPRPGLGEGLPLLALLVGLAGLARVAPRKP